MASNSIISFPLSLISLGMAIVSIGISVNHKGNGDINIAAWGICSLLCALVGIGYGIASLLEKEKKYILAKISLGLSGALLVFWMVLIQSMWNG